METAYPQPNQEERKVNPYRTADICVVFALLFALVAHAATNYISTDYIKTGKMVEVNPIAEKVLEAEPKFRYLFSLVLMPSMFFGLYYYMRKRIKDHFVVGTYAVMIMLSTFINSLNDVSYLIGLI